jgi:hypothetical protein
MTNHAEHILIVFILGALIWLFGYAVLTSIDRSIQNQDRMLCNSAKVSGNVQYLQKCQCYYEKGDIKCLQNQK